METDFMKILGLAQAFEKAYLFTFEKTSSGAVWASDGRNRGTNEGKYSAFEVTLINRSSSAISRHVVVIHCAIAWLVVIGRTIIANKS